MVLGRDRGKECVAGPSRRFAVKTVFPWTASRANILYLAGVLITVLQYVYTRLILNLCGSSGPSGYRGTGTTF